MATALFEFDFSESSPRGSSDSGGTAGGRVVAPPPAKSKSRAAAAFRKLEVLPWKIVIDTREQLPYSFDSMVDSKRGKDLVVPTVVAGLPSGDYSIENWEESIAIERKSLQDLYGSTISGRERFEKEIARLNDGYLFAAVVIEATWDEILDPFKQDPLWMSRAKPASVIGTIWQWSIRYARVHWYPAGTRRAAGA